MIRPGPRWAVVAVVAALAGPVTAAEAAPRDAATEPAPRTEATAPDVPSEAAQATVLMPECPPGTTAMVPAPQAQAGGDEAARGAVCVPVVAVPPAPPSASPAEQPRDVARTQPADPKAEAAAAERAVAERALERALVQKGGLVVPPGGVEIVPELTFSYSDGSAPQGATSGAGFDARSEILTGSMTIRLGLPLRLQAEATAPFVMSRLTPRQDPESGPQGASEGSGLGDVRLGLTWHLVRGRARLPDLLVGGFWKSRSGKTSFDEPERRVPLGTGVEQFGGTIAIVKAVDPLVLLATGSYAWSAPRWIPQGWLEAGDEFGGSGGAVLAVSPETSLSFALEALHTRPLRLDDAVVFRSDRTSAVFRFGVATAASRRSFLQVNVGIGLTDDVPRFEVALATPVQF